MSKSDNVVSELLGAIDTVVGKRLQQLPYDKTIICTIVDDSNAKNGEYKVTDGSVKFSAKCENANYRVDDQVRVSVPNGDTTQEKFILGKYVKDNSTTPITYMSPLSSVLQMSGNLCTSNNSTFGLQATGTGAREEIMLWSTSIDGTNAAMLGNSIYDILYIQADFKTILSNYTITSGTYGLELRLGTTLQEGQPGPAITCVYDSTQMMGNPYAFGIYTTQAAKFDITNISNITSMQLWFYQDGNFKHITHSAEPTPIPTDNDINNILIKNIQIGFGADLANVADETIKLYTTNNLNFSQTNDTVGNTKYLQFAWYNKDENGKYIGFDDAKDPETGEIKFIDEDEYLIKAGENEQLKAQQNYNIPMDRAGLNLASETVQIKTLMLELSTALSKDLYQMLGKFKKRCNISDYQSTFENLQRFVSKQEVTVEGETTTLSVAATDLYNWYTGALNHAAAIYNVDILPTTLENEWTFAYAGELGSNEHNTAPDYLKAFTDYFNDLYNLFYPFIDEETKEERRFLNDLYKLVTTDFTGYKGIYDDYNLRITKLFKEIWLKWEKIGNLSEEIETDEETGKSMVIKPLGLLINNKSEIEAYFRGGYSFIAWVETDLSVYNNGYCIYWYRYTPESKGDNFMPQGWERIEEAGNNNSSGISVVLDATTMVKEQFQVVVIYNHEKYISNIVTFENLSPVVNTVTALLSDTITINHGENSQESYQSYSVANTLINGADRYKKRELEVQFAHHDGEVDNEALVNAQIYWYVPKNATMLTFDTVDLLSLNKNNDFVNDIEDTSETKSEYQRDGFTCFYKTIGYGLTATQKTDENGVGIVDDKGNPVMELPVEWKNDLKFAYRIKEYYSPASAQNTIICKVVKDDIKYETEILMNFSSYGTSGTDYTLVVAPAKSQAAAVAGENWELKIALYNNKNEQVEMDIPKVDFLLGNNAYTIAKDIYQKDEDALSWYIEIATDANKTLCDILTVSVEVLHGEATEDEGGKTVKATTYFPIPYSSNVNYYIEGATTVVYDSQGGNPSYYKDPYNIYKQAVWVEKEGDTEAHWDTSVPEHSWSLHYTPGVSAEASEMAKKAFAKVEAYLPKLSSGTLLPSHMWVDGGDMTYDGNVENDLGTSHCAYVQCRSGNNILWSQPILIIQNRYPSPMLNAWDGKFTIDEKNGTIMSTMVSAGRKTKNNTFEGVLMGDIEGGAGFNLDNKRGLGLYGFNDGAQSFGFNIDGTAFLGKSGRGRILFDGNSGSISSASYQQTRTGNTEQPSTAGMMIDLDDGFIDMLGTKKNDNGLYETDGTQSRVHLDVKSPYFYIKSQTGVELIHIGDKGDKDRTPDYYLQTNDFKLSELWAGESYQSEKDPGAGMKLNLAQGKIQAYNFELRGEDSRKDAKTLGSYMYLSSDPADMVRVRYRNNDFDTNGIDVLAIGTNDYILKSFNWWDEASDRIHDNITPKPLTGMQINLQDGILEAYAENGPDATNWFRIDASYDSIVPLAIGNRGNPAFKVHWDGSLSINGDAFTVDKDGNITMAAGSIKIGDNFAVDKDGILQATSATMNKLTAIGAALTDLVVTNDAQFNGSINSTGNAQFAGTATFGGNTEITGNLLTKNGTVTLGGNTKITGTLITEGTNVTVSLGGNTTITGSLNTTGTATFGGNTFITGTMTIGSSSTSLGQLITYGPVELKGTTSITGATTITGNLTTTGDSVTVSLGGTTTVKGDLKITDSGSLSVSGISTFNGKTTINNSLEIAKSGTLSVSGKSTLSSLDVTGNSTFKAVQFNSTIAVGEKFGKTDEKTLDIPWSLKVVTLKFTNGICTDIVEGNKEGEGDSGNVPVVAQDWADKRYVQHGQNKAVSFTWDNLANKPSTFTPSTHNNDAHETNYASEERVSSLASMISNFNTELTTLAGRVLQLEKLHDTSVQSPQ